MNAMVRQPHLLILAAMVLLLSSVTVAQRKQVARPPQQLQQQTDQQQTQAQPDQQNVQQNQAAPVQSSLCANRPLCYEATDFVATVTEFRTSTDRYGNKVIDAMMHFQNKTNQPISLGYVDGSGSAIDDLGNRLGLNTYNGGVRGMGVVAGNNMDPKFTLSAGGGGDARFEMYWSPRNQLSGVTYEMEMSLREMVRVEGNQWTLGDESLIHYQGLSNGVGVAPVSAGGGGLMNSGSGSAMGVVSNNGFVQQNGGTVMAQPTVMGQTNVAGAQPCPPGSSTTGTLANAANTAGTQNQTANNAVSNASAAISNLGSMFKKKKPAAAPTATAAPCTPAANTGVAANGMMQTNTAAPMAAPGTMSANPAVNPKATVVGGRVVTAPVVTPAVQKTTVVNAQRPAATTTTTAQPTPAVTRTALKQPAPATTKPATAAKKPAASTTTTNTTNTTTNTGATK